ncbi:MAG: glycosyltransferase [Eggerthellaceae bacterium]|jgi:processive 1,2-diacylglycerol beta-glucosyltransferase
MKETTGSHSRGFSTSAQESPSYPSVSAAQHASQLSHRKKEKKDPLILIVHASVGSGHRSAANAIAEAFSILQQEKDPSIPKNLKVEVLDILDWGRVRFDGDKFASGFTGATRPLYDVSWRYGFTGRVVWGGGTIWSRLMFPEFTKYVRDTEPIAIICTHITAANVAIGTRMINDQDYRVVCVPTDYEAEGLWPHRYTDLFCTANVSMSETLRARRISDKRITVTGIPAREDFRLSHNDKKTKEVLGLPQDKMIVTALAGAYLPRPYVRFREALDEILPYLHPFKNMHFVFIAGKDVQYAEHLRKECAELGLTNATVLEYVNNMAALMSASSLVICKAGGLTVTECLAAQTPMILMGQTYGQEKVNMRMLTAAGAALHVTTPRELLSALRHIEKDSESLRAMEINSRLLRHPDAARDIAKKTIALAKKPRKPDDPLLVKHFMRFYIGDKPAHVR